MLVAVADMALVETITPRVVSRHRARLAAARFLVADCNLGSDTLIAIGRIAERHGVPLLIDPVSVPKARRLGEFLRARGRLFAATPNRGELARLAGFPVIDEPSLARAARLLHRRGVAHVLVGLGAEGSYLFSATDGRPFGLRLAPGAGSSRVRDVTGGGDAMVAGFAFGIASGESAAVAARRAATLAARTVGTLASAASAARGGARRMQP
jgi:pseudouridine kinase